MSVSARLARELRTAAPFAARALQDFLSVHAIPGRDRVYDDSSEHAIDVPSGLAIATVHWREIVADGPSHVVIPVSFELPDPGSAQDIEAAALVVRRMLDLDAPASDIVSALGETGRLSALVASRPGLRVPGARGAEEFALGTVLGQQVSIAAARTLQGRLVDRFARPVPGLQGFLPAPDIARIAKTPASELREALRLTGARAETLRILAEALSNGLSLQPDTDQVASRAALLALRGIGPWTVEMIAMRAFGDRDAFPAGDLILRRALDAGTELEARQLAAEWQPYRAYATQHLWAAYLEGAAQRSR